MEKIVIHSPETFKIPGGKHFDDFIRKITLESYHEKGEDLVLTFETKSETERFVDFIKHVRTVNKVDGFYTIQFVNTDTWIKARMIEHNTDTTITLKYFQPAYKRMGGNPIEI